MTWAWPRRRRPFRIERTERGAGLIFATVWDADGHVAATGSIDMCERRFYGWDGFAKLTKEDTMERLLADIDDRMSPTNMTLEEAKEFLEQLSCEIETRLDGIKDSIKGELRGRANLD